MYDILEGDCILENEEHWGLYMLLRQIINFATSLRITKEDTIRLKTLIQNFL